MDGMLETGMDFPHELAGTLDPSTELGLGVEYTKTL